MGSIEILRRRDEANVVPLERLNVVEAINERTTEAVELPDRHGFELARGRVLEQTVQSWPGLLGAAHLVFVKTGQIPASIGQVFLQFGMLKGGILLMGAHSDVQRYSHAYILT